MKPKTTSAATNPTAAEVCRSVARRLGRLDECRRRGLPTEAEEEALRTLWTDLGLAYAREAVRVAELRHRAARPG
ncbi:hypothetical protein FF100_29190 [Methylobacterium terricola]|uniref:Uncharacterized protein n=1 Tax=Methylobacterium terricola TaxID=2583531 RepID=A0A5C4L985_9HYPH|nr:hypothetical protein [Methylobacterium terricola]TNC08421.1 hypothetical protein FF100_29190 [Methylobacterium terricola]